MLPMLIIIAVAKNARYILISLWNVTYVDFCAVY